MLPVSMPAQNVGTPSNNDSIWMEKGNVIHNVDMQKDVGIGTEQPTRRLDVDGNARIRDLGGDSLSLVVSDQQGNLDRIPLETPEISRPNGSQHGSANGGGSAGIAARAVGAWSTTGNNELDEDAHFLGTTDAVDLVLKTDGEEQGRITSEGHAILNDSLKVGQNSLWLGGVDQNTGTNNTIYADNGKLLLQTKSPFQTILNSGAVKQIRSHLYQNGGNVGIGTFRPQKKLEVTSTHIRTGDPTGPCTDDDPLTKCPATESHSGIRLKSRFGTGVGHPDDFIVLDSTTWDLVPRLNNRQLLFRNIKPNNEKTIMALDDTGNVGIGTTAPSAQLHIKPPDDRPRDLLQLGNGNDFIFTRNTHATGNNDFGLNLRSSGGAPELFIKSNAAGTNRQTMYFGHSNGNRNIFGISTSGDGGSSWEPRFTIDQNGQVGIGTNAPPSGFKLAVCGKIKAKEVEIEMSDWCDEVFGADYLLPTLQDRQQWIDSTHHMPYFPPEEKVEGKGAPMGRFMNGLARNTEEQYRYLFRQQKQNRQQDQKLEELERKNRQLKQQVKNLQETVKELQDKVSN